MANETYHSSTHGPIPLSFTGRRLMQNLRLAAQGAIRTNNWHASGEALSRARGELAQYISELELHKKFQGMKSYDSKLEDRLELLELRILELEETR